MNTYTPGQLVQCTAVFSDPASHEVVEPNGVVAKAKDPTGTVSTPTVVSEGNRYSIWLDTTGIIPGEWWYRFTSPNPTQAAQESTFMVNPSAF